MESQANAILSAMTLGLALGMAPSQGVAQSPKPSGGEAIVIRLDRPDRQAAAVIGLFDGARAAHPAAALAAWKRASGGDLGKALEAAIALFNPLMSPEWRAFDGATLVIEPGDPRTGPRYRALCPHDDDGALAALIMTTRLGAGADLPELQVGGRRLPVVSLGQTGSLLAAQDGPRLTLASNRESLARMLDQAGESPAISLLKTPLADGLTAAFDLERMSPAAVPSLALGRALICAQGLGLTRLETRLALHDDQIQAQIEGQRTAAANEAPSRETVDPSWIDGFSHESMMAIIAVAIAPGGAFVDRAFGVVDRVLRLDPAYATTAPARTRLNLTTRTAGVNLEADLWPRLLGFTAAVTAAPDAPGKLTGLVLILHTNSEASATRLVRDVAPRLGRLAGGLTLDAKGDRLRGQASGRPLEIDRRGRSVRIAWGADALAALAARPAERPTTLVDQASHVSRLALVWPARCIPGLGAMDAAIRKTLADDPPVVWLGRDEGPRTHDTLVWKGLRARTRAFLDRIPLDPPPADPARPHS